MVLTLSSSSRPSQALPSAVGYQEAVTHPEVSLYYPGSRILEYDGQGEYAERCRGPILVCTPADIPAYIQTTLVAEAKASDDVFIWYDDQLVRRGWRAGLSNANEIRAYQRGPRERFQLEAMTAKSSQELLGSPEPLIWYSISYSLESCPSIDVGCRTNVRPVPGNDDRLAPPIPTGRIFVGDLMARPEAHLYVPGSSLMQSSAIGEGGGHLIGYADPQTRADLIAPGASDAFIREWYGRTLSPRGWTKVSATADTIEYRRDPRELLSITFGTSGPSLGYGVSGLSYTVIYLIDTCSGHPLALC